METTKILADVVNHPLFKGSYRLEEAFRCAICGGVIINAATEGGLGWVSGGWMCAKSPCPKCRKVHIITDSRLFCFECERDRATCGTEPQVFVRDEFPGRIEK